jgi:phage terminase large subunit
MRRSSSSLELSRIEFWNCRARTIRLRAWAFTVGLERNVESIRSLEGADIVWIEEARTISARSMEILLPTVRNAGSEMIWTWNPEQPTDPVDAYFRGRSPPPNAIVTRVDYTDNPYFDDTELPAEMLLLQQNNPERYRHVWLGEYDTRYESKVFTNVTIGRPEVPVNCPPRYGLDFGFSTDPSFIVKVYVLDPTRQIYIAAEASGRVTMDQLPALIASVVRDPGDLVRADSSQPGTIEFLQSRGFGAVAARKGQGSVREGITFLQGLSDRDRSELRSDAQRSAFVFMADGPSHRPGHSRRQSDRRQQPWL